ncbi:Alpha/Beta hydrolase protein [Schizophyllum amplum]|uniref:feruloyl esterase n=1 Tax=Schizophyllum amplum TaxID=97359 RepID=A0A550BZ92_9AGAR|nr:Alpha/Beta hydrolase protein [Auriculariopsis ampla]
MAQAAFIPHPYTHSRRAFFAPRASSACGRESNWTFDSDGHYTQNTIVSGNARQYLVHIPDDFDNDIPRPLVLSFHGAEGTSAHQEQASQLSLSGQTIGGQSIIAVYPQGLVGVDKSSAWDAAPYANPNAHDVEFTLAILDEVADALCIDTSRIYASGKSNGGGFTNRLACTPEVNSRVAAFGMASGAYYPAALPGDACQPGRQVPILLTHGTGDTTVPYNGKPHKGDGTEPNIDDFSKNWAQRNGFAAKAYAQASPHDNTDLWAWGGAGDRGQVKRYRVKDMQHVWPTTVVGSDKDGLSAPFNLTRSDLLPFFEQYSL